MLGGGAVPANATGATNRATHGPVRVSESSKPQKPFLREGFCGFAKTYYRLRRTSVPNPDFRKPGENERAIIARLLSHEFAGVGALRRQSKDLQVRSIDPEGSLELRPADGAPVAQVAQRVPIEAELKDHDGDTIHILLHVVDGLMNELEVYRESLGVPQRGLNSDRLRVLSLKER